MMKSQGSDTEKINLVEGGKKIDIDEVIKRSESIDNSLKPEGQKNIENLNPRVLKTSNDKIMLLSKCTINVIVKNIKIY